MSRLVVVEDKLETQMVIDVLTHRSGRHKVVEKATNIKDAHAVLTEMALGNVEADFVLVDGHLGTPPGQRPDFRFTHPGRELPMPKPAPLPVRKKWSDKLLDLALSSKPAPVPVPVRKPYEIVVGPEPKGSSFYADGIQVCTIIRRLGLSTEIIGISSEDAEHWGGDVDYDLTKGRAQQIVEFLDEISSRPE